MLAHRSPPLITRCTSALWAASFLMFLVYSAPHQVHHSFEQLPKAHHHDGDHEHPKHGTNHGSSAEAKCVFQLSASRCHVGLAWQLASVSLWLSTEPFPLLDLIDNYSTHFAAAVQIRAPPSA
jgi:hypothetical protein